MTPCPSGDKLDMLGVQCIPDKSQHELASRLAQGQQVTVKGVVTGKIGNVVLLPCKIE